MDSCLCNSTLWPATVLIIASAAAVTIMWHIFRPCVCFKWVHVYPSFVSFLFFPFEQPFFPNLTPLKLYCTSKGKPAKNARTLLLLWLPSKMGVPVQHGSFLSSPLPQCCTWCSDGLTLLIYFVKHQLGLAYEEWEVLVFASCLPISTHRLVHTWLYSCGHVLNSKSFHFRWQWTQLWLLSAVCV